MLKILFAARWWIILGLGWMAAALQAQDSTIPELAFLLKQYDAELKGEVLRANELGLADLKSKFTAALDRAQEAAQKAGNLDEALALKAEKQKLAAGEGVPAQDDPSTPPALKQLRATYRSALTGFDLDRERKVKPIRDRYMVTLGTLVTNLTKDGRLEDATAVKKVRDSMAAEAAAASTNPPAQAPSSSKNAIIATQERPFINTLGMKFVPVPGTSVLMCIHETRQSDYAAYAAENPDINGAWKTQSLEGIPSGAEPSHPVVGVDWDDSSKFCAWLSKKEGRTYRLPTDREWSYAAGIGTKEKKDLSPGSLSEKIKDEYPWGTKWPPPPQAGNFADSALLAKVPKLAAIEGYTDGFVTTAPVMSFKANKLGIFDLAGNAWEWCEDWYDGKKVDRVSRGGSFRSHNPSGLVSSLRDHTPPNRRGPDLGFRCVIVVGP